MTFVLTRDADAFAQRVWPFVEARIDCNVLATVLLRLRDGFHSEAHPLFAYASGRRGEVRAAVARMPPYPLLTSNLSAADADMLVPRWLEEDPSLPGATAPPATLNALSSAWRRCTGGTTRVRLREAMHVLEHVEAPPHPGRGHLRPAREPEADLLAGWLRAFAVEAGVTGGNESARTVRARMKLGGLYVWDDGGPVSLLGANPPVAGVVRIGPVYTPPQHRRRGYAGHAVAGVARLALEAGASRCMLFTDLDNPTSNKIYAEVGFRVIGDWEEHEFLAPTSAA